MSIEYKNSTKLRLLTQVIAKIHNPQVIDAYPVDLDGQSGADGQSGTSVLREWLTIAVDDSVIIMILKLLAFYLACGKLMAVATIPVDYAVKAQALRPQLCIVWHPVGRDRLKGGKKRGNYQNTIPHFNGDTSIALPVYTLGQFTCIYRLIDNSYIMVNASTEAEASRVVTIMAGYTKENMRPPGAIIDNLKITKRSGRQIDKVKLSPHRVDYYEGRGKGFLPLWQLNIKAAKVSSSNDNS